MTRVILRSIRLSLITSNYSCGSVSYVLITSRNEAGDLWSLPWSRCISSVRDYMPTLKIDYHVRVFSLLLGKVIIDRMRDQHECLDWNRSFFLWLSLIPDYCSSARSNHIANRSDRVKSLFLRLILYPMACRFARDERLRKRNWQSPSVISTFSSPPLLLVLSSFACPGATHDE